MADNVDKELSERYCPRFGKIAVEMGFVTADQVKQALADQLDDDLANRPHRLLGRIMLDNAWMTPSQIEKVMNELFALDRMG